MAPRLRRAVALAAVAAGVAPAAAAAPTGPLVVAFTATSPTGTATVRVVGLDGRQRARLRLPQLPISTVSAGAGDRVLATTQSGAAYLIDAAAGTVRRVAVPGGAPVAAAGPSYGVGAGCVVLQRLSDGGAVAVLDARTGRVTDIARLGGAPSLVLSGSWAPGGRTLAAIGRHTWLIPCDRPGRAASVPDTWLGPRFSWNGDRAAFLDLHGRGGRRLVVVTSADGSHAHASDPGVPGLDQLAFLPDGRLLLAGSSGLYVSGTGRTRRVGTVQGVVLRTAIDPGGRGAVVGVASGSGDANRWTWTDLRGASHPVAALRGFVLVPPASPGRYAYFLDDALPGPGAHRVGVLDLATGRAHVSARLGAGQYESSAVAAGGRGLLVTMLGRTSTQLWLVAASGTPRLVAEAPLAAGRFSPNGAWLAVSTRGTGRAPARLRLLRVGGGASVAAGAGQAAAWAVP